MNVNEIFIYNETYQLPKEAFTRFKPRVQACNKNPMCLNNVKYDAETFIAGYAKKVGSKIENGEESSFFVGGNFADSVTTQTTDGQKLNPIKILVLAGALYLTYRAITQKNLYIGMAALAVALIFTMKNESLDNLFAASSK